MQNEARGSSLVVRADADARTGVGHVMRALAVAQAWQDSGGATLALFARPNPAIERRYVDEGVAVRILDCDVGSADDAAAVIGTLAGVAGPAVALLDGYGFRTGYLQSLGRCGRPVVLFDDYLQADQLPVQLLVNQNLYATDDEYAQVAPGSRLLTGPAYLVLRREFRRLRETRRPPTDTVRRIVVTLGGGDADDVTGRVLEAMASMRLSGIEVVVLAGAHYAHLAELRARLDALGEGFRLEVDRRDMPALLQHCDIAICGAGTTCWEMAYMGIATLAVILAANQQRIADAVDSSGIGISLGWHGDLTSERISRALEGLIADRGVIRAMSAAALATFDGLGAERVVDAMAALASGQANARATGP